MIIGIDLGTSTSEAAVFRDGKPEILKNPEGGAVTPSFVGLDENGRFIAGQKAAEQFLLYPERTASEVKRRMGTEEKLTLGESAYTPIELSAKLLAYIKDYAEQALGVPVESAVITVPAYFDDIQRKETVQAGTLAGLRVERIINEPTAAAMCYGIEHLEDESNILVYDLGGGTFDVTVLELYGGVMEVKASGGRSTLGGKDFDERLMGELISRFKSKHRGADPQDSPYAMAKLKEAAVACKTALSSCESYNVILPLLMEKDGSPLSLNETVTREEFEALITDLVEQTGAAVQKALRDAGLTKDDLDLVLLVGGSTRIPFVRRYVGGLLDTVPGELVDPDLSVAMGAAIQAGILKDELGDGGLLITDVCPFALGVRCLADIGFMETDDYMSVILPRNTTIPVTQKSVYSTAADWQKKAVIEVYQGDSKFASENRFLGKYTLKGIPPKKKGEERIEISFSYDANGILGVQSTVLSTGESAFTDIDMTGTSEYIKKLRDVSGWKSAPKSARYRSVIRKAQRLLDGGDMDADRREDLGDVLYALKCAVIDDSDADILERYESELLELMEECQ